MSELVWDSSALLMVINEEPGWQAWADLLPKSAISTVNLSEVAAKLNERGGALDTLRPFIDWLAITVFPFTADLAYAAGELRASTRELGLSLGARACLALARELRAPALTADRAWAGLDIGVEIRLAR